MPAMDRLRELEAFVAVVDAGSFVGAAKRLRTSKAATSRAVQALEERLGARLLHRTTRRLSLTDEGRGYHARAKTVLQDLAEADGLARRRSATPVGRLRVSAPQSYGVIVLAPLWAKFLGRYPELELELTLSDRLVDLVEEGVDAAIRISRLPDSTLISRRLGEERMRLCASKAYLARNGTPRRLEDLARHRTLAYAYWASGDSWHFETPDGPRSVTVRPSLRTNSGDTCVEAAVRHGGVILQPDFLVREHLRAGALVELLPEYRGPSFGVFAVYPSRAHLPGKVKALVDFLGTELGNAAPARRGVASARGA